MQEGKPKKTLVPPALANSFESKRNRSPLGFFKSKTSSRSISTNNHGLLSSNRGFFLQPPQPVASVASSHELLRRKPWVCYVAVKSRAAKSVSKPTKSRCKQCQQYISYGVKQKGVQKNRAFFSTVSSIYPTCCQLHYFPPSNLTSTCLILNKRTASLTWKLKL